MVQRVRIYEQRELAVSNARKKLFIFTSGSFVIAGVLLGYIYFTNKLGLLIGGIGLTFFLALRDIQRPSVSKDDIRGLGERIMQVNRLGVKPRGIRLAPLVNDSLIDTLTPAEIDGLVRHEAAHVLNSTMKKVSLSEYIAPLGLTLLGIVNYWFNVPVSVLTVCSLGMFWATYLLGGWLMRTDEYAADRFAMEHSEGDAYLTGLCKLSNELEVVTADDRTTTEYLSRLLDTHPPVVSRIENLAGKSNVDVHTATGGGIRSEIVAEE